ncbi:MAG TPA: pilus assembly protein PilM [Geobacteraceae bacterium]
MVLISGKPHAPRLDAYGAATFPPETLKLSVREANVINPASFVSIIRGTYLKLLAGTSRISVSLPDAIGRVVLLDLETRFKTRDEGADMIRWKLKKHFPIDINEMHLDYQVLQERDSGEISMLVSLISRQVLNQYEELLAEAGLEPNRIDFTMFNMYRFFSGRLEIAENAALMAWHDGMISIMVFRNGLLDFYRSKELSGTLNGMNRIFREIDSSFLVYKEKQPGYSLNEVFCIAPHDDAETFRAVVAEATGVEPVLLDTERIVSRKEGISIDAKTLHPLTAAMGAAVRNL